MPSTGAWNQVTVSRPTVNVLSKNGRPRGSVIEDKNGKLLTDRDDVIKRWTEYCDELYNFSLNPDTSMLQDHWTCTSDVAESPPVLRDEVEEAMR